MLRDLLMGSISFQLALLTGETLLAIDPERAAVQVRAAADAPAGTGIAVIPLQGALSPRGVSFFGRQIAPGMNDFRAAGARAAADPGVGAIVLDVNSPGGTYAGTPETANAVRQWAEVKPVIAVVDALCASAAYFIASQASQIAVTPSGELGSLGVIAQHMEFSKALEKDGVTVNMIRSRPNKADVNPFEPLSEEAMAAIQASVQEADNEFLAAVAKGRGKTAAQVRQLADEGGLGRLVSAKRAVELGMADKVATMPEVLAGLIKSKAQIIPARRRSALAF